MTIEEKLIQIAENEQKVYNAGYVKGKSEGNDLYYASKLNNTFENTVFPENHNMVLRLRNCGTLYRSFALAKNLKSVKMIVEDKETSLSLVQVFRECTDLEEVDLTGGSTKISKADYLFYQSNKLESIWGALDLSECTEASLLNYAFFASALKDVEFVPNTIKASIRFNSAYLSNASIESIINGLADLTGGATQTLTLNGVGRNLAEDQKARISAKNWTLAY